MAGVHAPKSRPWAPCGRSDDDGTGRRGHRHITHGPTGAALDARRRPVFACGSLLLLTRTGARCTSVWRRRGRSAGCRRADDARAGVRGARISRLVPPGGGGHPAARPVALCSRRRLRRCRNGACACATIAGEPAAPPRSNTERGAPHGGDACARAAVRRPGAGLRVSKTYVKRHPAGIPDWFHAKSASPTGASPR